MGNPLNFEPVTPMKKAEPSEPVEQDARPFWLRFFASLRPKVSIEHEGKTGKRYETVEITGHADF